MDASQKSAVIMWVRAGSGQMRLPSWPPVSQPWSQPHALIWRDWPEASNTFKDLRGRCPVSGPTQPSRVFRMRGFTSLFLWKRLSLEINRHNVIFITNVQRIILQRTFCQDWTTSDNKKFWFVTGKCICVTAPQNRWRQSISFRQD